MDAIASRRVNQGLLNWENGLKGALQEVGQLGHRVVTDDSLNPSETHAIIRSKIEALQRLLRSLIRERSMLEKNWVFNWKGKALRYALYGSAGITWLLQEGGDATADIIDAQDKQEDPNSDENENPFASAITVKWASKILAYLLTLGAFGAHKILVLNKEALDKLKTVNEEKIRELQQLTNWLELLAQVEEAKESSEEHTKRKRKQDLQNCLRNYNSLPASVRNKLPPKEIITMRILNDFACEDLSIKEAYNRITEQAKAKKREERRRPKRKKKRKKEKVATFGEQASHRKFNTSGKFRAAKPAFLIDASDVTSDSSEEDEVAYDENQLLIDYKKIAKFAGGLDYIPITHILAVDQNAEFWKPEEFDEERFGKEEV